MAGPLTGIRVLEVPNIGPVQFAGMLLADLGAEVLRLDRAEHVAAGTNVAGFVSPASVVDRGRRSAGVDLKHPDGAALVRRLCRQADVLVEGFRPGVAERLGIGPDDCRRERPELVYARMTGWGQDGPLAGDVGHDVNYVALSGVLGHLGPPGGPPMPPINLLADFAGGGSLVVLGILAALVERSRSGQGQVIDAAMIDGTAQLMSIFWGLDVIGTWGPPGTNMLDGGSHFYNVYRCADGRWFSIAAYEPKFYGNLVAVLHDLGGFDDLDGSEQMDATRWPELKERFARLFESRARDEWTEVFAGREICVAPVLTMSEAREHPQHVARRSFVDVGGIPQPAPAPRFDRTPTAPGAEPVAAGAHTDTALADWGLSEPEITALRTTGAIA